MRHVAWVWLLVLPQAAGALPAWDAPDGCAQESGRHVCRWTVQTLGEAAAEPRLFEIPVFDRSLATVTVILQGEDHGWRVRLLQREGDALREVSSTTHRQTTGATPTYTTTESMTHVILRGGDASLLEFTPAGEPGPVVAGRSLDGPASQGTFTVVYQAEEVPEGVVPARPAATRDVPHIRDVENDAARPETDLLAAWLDDARLGDGLFDAHIAVRDLSDVRFDTQPALRASAVQWQLHFRAQGIHYYVHWERSAAPGAPPLACGLWRADDVSGIARLLARPLCVLDEAAGEMHAVIPERSIGTPGDGERFLEMSANADVNIEGYPDPQDAAPAQFAFALGGPAVWDELNTCAFCPPAAPSWIEAPLDSENLPNTLQVAGALAATATFVVGLVLVRRRARQTRRLLAEIRAVEESHEGDTRAGLLALGALDSRFAAMHHKGAMTDAQYQVVSQRVAAAATRFALRHGLGLDDGVPGDAPTRTIPVQDLDARREVRP